MRVRGRGFQAGRGRPGGRGLPSSAAASRPGGDRQRWVRAVAFITKSIKGFRSNISSKLAKVKSRSRVPCRLGAVPRRRSGVCGKGAAHRERRRGEALLGGGAGASSLITGG